MQDDDDVDDGISAGDDDDLGELRREEELRNVWPESCPLSEEELRVALRHEIGEIQTVVRRMQALYAKLARPVDEDAIDFDEVPATVYFTLRVVLGEVSGEMLTGAVEELERALAATPESLKKKWLESSSWRGGAGGGFIIPG